MRVLITGGAGFIGANLARVLGRHPRVTGVVALDDLSTGDRASLDGVDAELVEGSILDGGLLDELVSDCDAVVHLAARPSVPRSLEDPLATHEVNATGTIRVLEAVRRAGGPYVVAASSSSVYGANPTLPKHEELAVAPVSPYAVSKLATEAYVNAYAASFGLPSLALRFFNVFGPLQAAGHAYAAVIPAFVDAALAGKPLPVHGDGRQTRDFTYVGSVSAVLSDAVLRRVTHPAPVNLAFGSRRSLLDVAAALGALLGTELDREHLPSRPGDVRDSQADQSTLRALFPEVDPVDFTEGLASTVAWFRGEDPW